MYIPHKQLLKSSTRSDRWLSKLDLKKEKSKYHVKDHVLCSKIVTNYSHHLPHEQLDLVSLYQNIAPLQSLYKISSEWLQAL